jgi:hypothetical protein
MICRNPGSRVPLPTTFKNSIRPFAKTIRLLFSTARPFPVARNPHLALFCSTLENIRHAYTQSQFVAKASGQYAGVGLHPNGIQPRALIISL